MSANSSGRTYDHLFKLLLVGDSGVGKTALVLRFTDDTFAATFISTIGIDFKIKTVELEGRKVKLQIWDTAGQERFRTITTAYYRGAMGMLLVYDITNCSSFDNIATWMRCVDEHAQSGQLCKLIVGNKCDLNEGRMVSKSQGRQLASTHSARFMETSARTGEGVADAFLSIAADIMRTVEVDKPASPDVKANANGSAVMLDEGCQSAAVPSLSNASVSSRWSKLHDRFSSRSPFANWRCHVI